jgi:hypothetical protein
LAPFDAVYDLFWGSKQENPHYRTTLVARKTPKRGTQQQAKTQIMAMMLMPKPMPNT